MKELWTEKYRPKTAGEYVFKDKGLKNQVDAWIKDSSIPNLLLSGRPGIGKTTLAKVLLNDIGIPQYDILEINASRNRGIAEVRDQITNFIQMMPFGPFKCVLLDEADRLTPEAQDAMKGVMEEYARTSRFILTCNSPNQIIPALHSRVQQLHFGSIDQEEFLNRIIYILETEGIQFEPEIVVKYHDYAYPDLRKCINLLQQNSTTGMLLDPAQDDSGVSDYKLEMIELFKQGRIPEARTLLCGRAQSHEIVEIFRWIYDHLDLFGDDDETKDSALLIIKQGLVDHTLVGDPEINLAAVLIKLARLKK
jgi:replication factor C small subunit